MGVGMMYIGSFSLTFEFVEDVDVNTFCSVLLCVYDSFVQI